MEKRESIGGLYSTQGKVDTLSVAEKEQDADYWITYKPITPCHKCFQIEVATFKKAMGKEFLDELQELVARHSAVE
tara:strand:+ start:2232 stop:2459 length:228 start_codon:yes stop_codon:yes gene_type:complete